MTSQLLRQPKLKKRYKPGRKKGTPLTKESLENMSICYPEKKPQPIDMENMGKSGSPKKDSDGDYDNDMDSSPDGDEY